MDYPDSDEEFEMMHAAEMEAMREMEEEDECLSPPPFSSKPRSRRSLDFGENLPPPSTTKKPVVVPQTPQEAQDTLQVLPSSKSADTTLDNSSTNTSVGCTPLDLPTKRTTEDLFGDISDIDEFSTPIHNASKRPKLDEEKEVSKEVKQDFLISRIVEMRKKTDQFLNPLSKNNLSSKFEKMEDCMSRKVPQWPFIPVCGYGDERIYLRLRSEEFDQEISDVTQCTKGGNLLSIPYSELKQLAKIEADKVMKKKELEEKEKKSTEVEAVSSKDLLVERYKPKSYLELLSDEGTNRSLLQWLKLWDKIVFNRNVTVPIKEESAQKFGWKSQRFSSKNVSQLNTELDENGRPQAKIALLCGPPGLGKTTLAHLIAVQAGYNVVEANASDDRSAQAFRTQLEAATQMKAVLGEEKRPNCLILDEIDGAPSAAIDVLVGFATDKEAKKGKGKKKGNTGLKGILRRPIICICNDVYVPALRPLRQIAFTLHFPPTSSARLGERLVKICRLEGVKTDLSTMIALGDKTNNDIRACLSVLHCIKAKTNKISHTQIQNANVGIKDMQQGLFSVWQAIFQIVKPKTQTYIQEGYSKEQASAASLSESKPEVSLSRARMAEVLRIVQGCGDYDRLVQGVYENFPLINTKKSVSFSSLALALKWFTFHDIVSRDIYANQNYVLYPYLLYGFVVWHFVFATYSWPKLTYPHVGNEMTQRSNRQKQLLNYCIEGSAAHVRAFVTKESLMMDCIPYILDIISPNMRTVSAQLLSQKEKEIMNQVVSVMIDYNLNYTQERNQDGVYNYNLDPNLEEVGRFPDWKAERALSYAGKQMISREIEVEKMRRAEHSLYRTNAAPSQEISGVNGNTGTPKQQAIKRPADDMATPPQDKGKEARLPSHLQKLTPKALKRNHEKPTKDFFGRIVEKKSIAQSRVAEDEIVKSDIWFHFKEGYNNAVRKTLYMEDLLKPSKWNSF